MTGKQNTGLLQLERQTHLEEKDAIGRLAAQHIENGDTVIFDSGTTTTAIADAISHIRRLSVVTTAVNIALKLGGEPGINVLLTGGTFKFPTLSTSGEKAASFFENVLAEKLFLATACISPRLGLSFPSETDIKVKMAMINSASTVYVVADSSKIDKVSMFALPCDWSHIHYLITDSGSARRILRPLKRWASGCWLRPLRPAGQDSLSLIFPRRRHRQCDAVTLIAVSRGWAAIRSAR